MSRIAFCFFVAAALHAVLAIVVAAPVAVMACESGDLIATIAVDGKLIPAPAPLVAQR